jgi:hypothetical protein
MFSTPVSSNRGDDVLRCRAEVLDKGEFYRCSRDANHIGKLHLCLDDNVYVSFDDWAAGEESNVGIQVG